MTDEHDYEDEQLKARVVRRPNGEDDGVTLYPLTQSVDDLKEAFPNSVSTDESGRAYLYLDEVHHLGNSESGRRLIEQMARSLRSGPSTRRERARAQVLDALSRTNLSLTRDGEPLRQSDALTEYTSAADTVLSALQEEGALIDREEGASKTAEYPLATESQFVASQFLSAEDKALAVNGAVRFLESGLDHVAFVKNEQAYRFFSQALSMHDWYNIHGFAIHHFEDDYTKARFLAEVHDLAADHAALDPGDSDVAALFASRDSGFDGGPYAPLLDDLLERFQGLGDPNDRYEDMHFENMGDIRNAFPNAQDVESLGRVFMGNSDDHRDLAREIARDIRNGPAVQWERARNQVVDALYGAGFTLFTAQGEPATYDKVGEVLSAANAILDALRGFGDVIDCDNPT